MRIALALSGGVDSAVAAVLLRDQGLDVVALTLRLQEDDNIEDSVRLADFLNLEHHIIDARAAFKKQVMEPFAQSYLRGQTPLPCALCNRFIKFGLLQERAKELGAKALATGHYARIAGGALYKGIDPRKDQSYFLFGLSHAQLAFARFPLGDKTKKETRAIAATLALPVAEKKDSVDVCFTREQAMDLLCNFAPSCHCERSEAIHGDAKKQPSGDIVDLAGNILGHHQGISGFTIGQRKGLNLGTRGGDHNEPLFVVAINPAAARVTVGPHQTLAQKEVRLREVNWLGDNLPHQPLAVQARLRSTQEPVDAVFTMEPEEKGRIILKTPVHGIAPGQAGVLYNGDRVLGGGWIDGAGP